jgi:hypothetical protein
VIYLQNFIKISSGIQTLMGEGIFRQHGDLISLLLFLFIFFQNEESRPKIVPSDLNAVYILLTVPVAFR